MSRPWYREPGAVPAVVVLVGVVVGFIMLFSLIKFGVHAVGNQLAPNPAQHPQRMRCVPAEQDGHRGWLCPDGVFIRKEKTT